MGARDTVNVSMCDAETALSPCGHPQQAEWSVERVSLQQQGQERAGWLEEQLTALQTEKDTEHTSAQARIVSYCCQLSLDM